MLSSCGKKRNNVSNARHNIREALLFKFRACQLDDSQTDPPLPVALISHNPGGLATNSLCRKTVFFFFLHTGLYTIWSLLPTLGVATTTNRQKKDVRGMGLSAVPRAILRGREVGGASLRVPRGSRASDGVPGTAPNNESRAWGALSRVLVVVCVRCPGGPRKLCKGTGTAASPGDDAQLEGSRPLHLPWPSPAQVPPSHVS